MRAKRSNTHMKKSSTLMKKSNTCKHSLRSKVITIKASRRRCLERCRKCMMIMKIWSRDAKRGNSCLMFSRIRRSCMKLRFPSLNKLCKD